jgi:hypothetical protein
MGLGDITPLPPFDVGGGLHLRRLVKMPALSYMRAGSSPILGYLASG